MPDARSALGAGPRLVERFDAFECGFHLARSRPAPAAMDLDVQRRAHVCFQVLEERLDRLQKRLGLILQRTPQPLEELANLALVVRLASSKRQRCPERLADLLQELLQRAPRLGGRAMDVAAVEPFARRCENARRFILVRSRPGLVAP